MLTVRSAKEIHLDLAGNAVVRWTLRLESDQDIDFDAVDFAPSVIEGHPDFVQGSAKFPASVMSKVLDRPGEVEIWVRPAEPLLKASTPVELTFSYTINSYARMGPDGLLVGTELDEYSSKAPARSGLKLGAHDARTVTFVFPQLGFRRYWRRMVVDVLGRTAPSSVSDFERTFRLRLSDHHRETMVPVYGIRWKRPVPWLTGAVLLIIGGVGDSIGAQIGSALWEGAKASWKALTSGAS